MGVKDKLIQPLYEIVIYVFPFFLLFFILVGFQMWKLEDTKEEMTRRLQSSTEIIEAARMELNAMRTGLKTKSAAFSHDVMIHDLNTALPDLTEISTKKQELVELGVNVLNRVSELKNDSVNYRLKDYVITDITNKYYAIVISYSEIGYAIVQREHLMALGFTNIKILETDKYFALSIDDADTKSDPKLSNALETWDDIFETQSGGYIKKF